MGEKMREIDSHNRQSHCSRLLLLGFCLAFALSGCGEPDAELLRYGIPCDQDHVGVEMCLDDHTSATCFRLEDYFTSRGYYEWQETDCRMTVHGPYCILSPIGRGRYPIWCGEDRADIPEHGVPYGGAQTVDEEVTR